MENRTNENSLNKLADQHEQIISDEATTTVSYFGFAEAGVATSDPKWIIMKVESASATSPEGVTTFKYAVSYKYDKNVWNDRATLIYVS